MTTFLITLFAVSLFSVIYILVIKAIEKRTNRKIFMPQFIADRDDKIRREIQYVTRKAILHGKYRTQIVGHTAYQTAKGGVKKVTSQNTRTDVPKGNGNGSAFLKRIRRHKEEIRGNGESGNIK